MGIASLLPSCALNAPQRVQCGARIVCRYGFKQAQLGSGASWRSVMSGNIFNSNGAHVGVVERR